MNNQVRIFENEDFGKIRVVDKDGQPWFVGKDITEILGYANASEALIDHVDEDDKLNSKTLLSLGQRGGWFINESGLYSLVLASKLPAAKAFKRWVTSEVLPSIRKHGAYIKEEILRKMRNDDVFASQLLDRLYEEQEKNEVLLDCVEELAPKATYFDLVLQSETPVHASIIAKACYTYYTYHLL